MDVFLRVDINIVSIIMLSIVFYLANKKLDKKDKLNRFFLISTGIIIVETSLETLTCLINGQLGELSRGLSYLAHFFLFSISPILTYSWSKFIKYWIIPDSKFSYKKTIVLTIPILINFILTILSLKKGYIFYLDENNIYHRGSLFSIFCIITYFYIVLGFLKIIVNRKKISKAEFVPLIFFGIFPLIGGIIQALFYKILLMWSSCGFSLVIVYTFLQNRMVTLDGLTGAWTRESFFDYFYQKYHYYKKDISLIFIDMDNLKLINDKYGHLEGDFAIKKSVSLIRENLRKTDIVSRYGGDEFIVMIDSEKIEKIKETLKNINLSFNRYNLYSKKPYELSISYGYGSYGKEYNGLEEFIYKIDKLMYKNKQMKKNPEFSYD